MNNKLSILFIGILIPIIAAFIPEGLKILNPEHDLSYEIKGLIKIKKTMLYANSHQKCNI